MTPFPLSFEEHKLAWKEIQHWLEKEEALG